MNQDSQMYNFLKKRRPDEFSDSTINKQGKLTREFLDYYLNSLTSRSQEKEFETFCRRLSEKEICSNLLPQTGPTGGGDSKVDSETYPVSETIALSWYTGIGKASASERWAFAFSAKKTWKPKCISDIEKIVATNRDYKEVYFITNQYVSDKNRAALEDDLRDKYKIGIHIMDRTWILEKVFINHYEDIAIDALHLSVDFKEEKDLGPLDYQRKKKIEKAEKKIMDCIASNILDLKLVELSIEVAILSKEMELPFAETKGKFERAINLAKEYGTTIQIKEICYQWAWASYWWYNNQTEFEKAYIEFESLVIDTNNFFDIERLTNLWMNLFTYCNGDLSNPLLKSKTETILDEYNKLISDTSRRNTCLEAKANLIFVRLFLEKESRGLFLELGAIIEEAKASLDFSFETIVKMISNLSDYYLDNPEFDALFENIINISESRTKEIDGAKLLLIRGKSFYPDKPYTAIRYIGRSLIRLYKSESKNQLIEALFFMGASFSQIGLYWASYGYYLNTLFIAFIDYMKFGNVSPLLLGCTDHLRRTELQSGLLTYSLEWNNLYNISKSLANSAGFNMSNSTIQETDQLFDGLLGVFFLNLEQKELKKLTRLPDNLDEHDLLMSAVALRCSLGYLDPDISNIYKEEEQVIEYINKWREQPAKEHMAPYVINGTEESVQLESKILGCLITLDSDLAFPCIEISKSILASIEAFMATSVLDRVMARFTKVHIKVDYIKKKKMELSSTFEEKDGVLYYHVFCNDYDQSEFVSSQSQLKEFLLNFIGEFVARVFIFSDMEQVMKKMVLDDQVFIRAIEFTNCVFVTDDLIGREFISLEKWIQKDSKVYEPKEIESQIESKSKKVVENNDIKKLTVNYEKPEQFDPEKINYNDIVMDDLINIPLWDKARWRGMLYLIYQDSNMPPVLAPVFSDKSACISIFKKWISDIGTLDSENKIKSCLIKGVDKNNPTYYKFAFSPNFDASYSSITQGHIITPSRFHLMESVDNGPLNQFLDTIKKTGNRYYLIPAIMKSEKNEPEILTDYAIRKCHLEIKNAWEIGKDSWWAFAILPEDNPIIPPFVIKAPVTELLAIKKMAK